MFCENHPKRIAIDQCAQCKVPLCSDCKNVVEGNVLCIRCANSIEPTGKIAVKQRNPFMAALLAFLMPGVGQAYNGQMGKGMCITFTCWLLLPWIYGIIDAYITAKRIDEGKIKTRPMDYLGGGLIIFFMILVGPYMVFRSSIYALSIYQTKTEDKSVKSVLYEVSNAAEEYAADNGHYPKEASDLFFGDKSYLDELYCDVIYKDYNFTCEFSKDGYKVYAFPIDKYKDKMKYRIITGGKLETHQIH